MKKGLRLAQFRGQWLQVCYEVNGRRICRIIQQSSSIYYYINRKDEQAALKMRIRDIAQARVSHDYRQIHVMSLREGWKINHKRVYRLYNLEGLTMRSKRPRRHVSACRRMLRATATYPNESWSMDFMSDALYDGQKIKLFTLVDNYTRESPAM
jgi:putative transposase